MTKEIITQDYVKQLFEYRDGELYRKTSISNSYAGDKVGGRNREGYLRAKINDKTYYLHRLIFLMHHGYLPKLIDHIDGNKLNNKIENLRAATHVENLFNRKAQKNSNSGVKNVCWSKPKQRWIVQLQTNNKQRYFGMYKDLELADLVAQEARDKYHGAFANHG